MTTEEKIESIILDVDFIEHNSIQDSLDKLRSKTYHFEHMDVGGCVSLTFSIKNHSICIDSIKIDESKIRSRAFRDTYIGKDVLDILESERKSGIIYNKIYDKYKEDGQDKTDFEIKVFSKALEKFRERKENKNE